MTSIKLMQDGAHLRQLASDKGAEAAAATLANVRDRCLEAERSFLELADRADALEAERRVRLATQQAGPPEA